MARPTKLTAALQQRIVAAIRAGCYAEQAAAAAGVHRATFFRWLARGTETGSGLYFEFLQAVRQAEAEAEEIAVTIIREAALDGAWQAAAWFLERKFPERWSRRDKVDVDVFLRSHAERIAKEQGLEVEEVIEEARRLLAEGR